MKSKAFGSFVGLLILFLLYVGAYLALVEPSPALFSGRGPIIAAYGVGGMTSAFVFSPVQALDERLRLRVWNPPPMTGDEIEACHKAIDAYLGDWGAKR